MWEHGWQTCSKVASCATSASLLFKICCVRAWWCWSLSAFLVYWDRACGRHMGNSEGRGKKQPFVGNTCCFWAADSIPWGEVEAEVLPYPGSLFLDSLIRWISLALGQKSWGSMGNIATSSNKIWHKMQPISFVLRFMSSDFPCDLPHFMDIIPSWLQA